jgi:hypothetical protein
MGIAKRRTREWAAIWILQGICCIAIFVALPATAAPTTNPAQQAVDEYIEKLNDLDPAAREYARLAILNYSGDAYEPVKAALERPDLPPAARPALRRALPRLRARARILAERAKDNGQPEELLQEWDRIGHKDPRWNQLVRDGIAQFLRATEESARSAHEMFDKALAAGCDDPLVLYLNARTAEVSRHPDPDELRDRYQAAAKAMLASQYTASPKMVAAMRYLMAAKDLPSDLPVDDFLKLASEASKEPIVARWMLADTFINLNAKLIPAIGREPAFNKVYPAFQEAMPNDWQPLQFKARFEIDWAWDARGNGTGGTVTPQGWKLFGERIDAARAALEQAWKLDPTQSAIYEQMITVCMAQSDRDGLEQWFQRGIEANPDDYRLCWNKMYAILPRWLGSHEEMLAFGRQCAATENAWGGIPNILLEAHRWVAAETPNAEEYFKQPSVWDETHKIFEDRILLWQTADNRSRFAEWAAKCGHWDVVAAQCDKLGDQPDRQVFPEQKAYEALRAKAKERMQQK